MKKYVFESDRLGFRKWNEEDKIPFAKMNSNKNVMRFFPKILTKEESDNFAVRIQNHFDEYGFGLWAVELKSTEEFIGFIGFQTATFESDFTPCIEIGWRLDDKFWNQGYATEGAKRCLKYGFENLNLNTIYSFTAEINIPSINVMQKIGMKKIKYFEHPKIDVSSEIRNHVLYKILIDK